MREEEGFVYTMRAGKKFYHSAIRFPDGKVARYQKDGEGVWCGKGVARTFFAHTWNVTRESLEAKIALIEEYDRWMPKRRFRYDVEAYTCLRCGCEIFDRTIHVQVCPGINRDETRLKLHETLIVLFGEGHEDSQPTTEGLQEEKEASV